MSDLALVLTIIATAILLSCSISVTLQGHEKKWPLLVIAIGVFVAFLL